MTAPIDKNQPAAIPTWIIAPILAWLVWVGAAIVCIAWMLLPVPQSVGTRTVFLTPKVAAVEELPMPAVLEEKPATKIEETPQAEPPVEVEPPRRLPVAEPMPQAPDTVEPTHTKPIALQWKRETTSNNFILPIEVAKVEAAPIQYSVRRLCLPGESKPLKIAVTPFVHDDVARVLTEIDDGYKFVRITKENVFSIQVLNLYDVVFLTCAELYAADMQAAKVLRKYVELGGTLYASDLQYDRLARAFPEFQSKRPLLHGIPQIVDATVMDKGLEAFLGRGKIPLSFDAPDWRPAGFDTDKATVCLKGTYRDTMGKEVEAPLVVKFRFHQGTVIFTSFHHTQNESAAVRKMLEYLAFSTLTARSEARVQALMRSSDFGPDALRPILVRAGQTTEQTCDHPGGGLQIALGFEHEGAKLKLTLRAPDGQSIEHSEQGLFLVEVPNAARGVWQYSISPLELPHRTFPVIAAVGRTRE